MIFLIKRHLTSMQPQCGVCRYGKVVMTTKMKTKFEYKIS
jgi:hypothetical protein